MGSRGALGSTTEFTAPAGLTMSPIGLCSVSPSERHADALKVPVVLSEPAHYIKAEHLFAEICHPSARANSSGKTTERAELAGNRPTYVSPDSGRVILAADGGCRGEELAGACQVGVSRRAETSR